MGWYTVAVFYNDNIHALEQDPEIGRRIHTAALQASIRESLPVPIISSGGQVGAVVEQQHADTVSVMGVSIGRGCRAIGYGRWEDTNEALVRNVARDMGFTLRRTGGKR